MDFIHQSFTSHKTVAHCFVDCTSQCHQMAFLRWIGFTFFLNPVWYRDRQRGVFVVWSWKALVYYGVVLSSLWCLGNRRICSVLSFVGHKVNGGDVHVILSITVCSSSIPPSPQFHFFVIYHFVTSLLWWETVKSWFASVPADSLGLYLWLVLLTVNLPSLRSESDILC